MATCNEIVNLLIRIQLCEFYCGGWCCLNQGRGMLSPFLLSCRGCVPPYKGIKGLGLSRDWLVWPTTSDLEIQLPGDKRVNRMPDT